MRTYNAGETVKVFSYGMPHELFFATVVRDDGDTLALKDARDPYGLDMVYGVPKVLCKHVAQSDQ